MKARILSMVLIAVFAISTTVMAQQKQERKRSPEQKKMMKRKIWIGIAIVAVVGVTFFSFTRDQKNFEVAKNLDIYHTLFRELNMFYVDEVSPNELVKTSIDQMLKSLDPYTNYISEDQIEDFRFMTTGEYAGIGALISKQKNKVVIAEPYEGFPAQKFGIKAGDIILEVSGKETKDMNTEDVSSLLKGPANNNLKGNASSGGNVFYSGNPSNTDINRSSGGNVIKNTN